MLHQQSHKPHHLLCHHALAPTSAVLVHHMGVTPVLVDHLVIAGECTVPIVVLEVMDPMVITGLAHIQIFLEAVLHVLQKKTHDLLSSPLKASCKPLPLCQ